MGHAIRVAPPFGTIGLGNKAEANAASAVVEETQRDEQVTSTQQMLPAFPPFLLNRLQFQSVSLYAAPACLPLYTLPSFSISQHRRLETKR